MSRCNFTTGSRKNGKFGAAQMDEVKLVPGYTVAALTNPFPGMPAGTPNQAAIAEPLGKLMGQITR
jgi:hypothetical protein